MTLQPSHLTFSKVKILAVDDNPQAMDILSQILLGLRVEQTCKCQSAKDAMPLLASQTFNLAVIDDIMPELDGFELVSALRADAKGRNYTMPVILASGDPTQLTVRRARDCGANFVITKPIVPGVLIRRMQWLSRNSRDFVTSDTYNGPDRRFRNLPLPAGVSERRGDALALMAAPDREMSQDEVNSLFN